MTGFITGTRVAAYNHPYYSASGTIYSNGKELGDSGKAELYANWTPAPRLRMMTIATACSYRIQ